MNVPLSPDRQTRRQRHMRQCERLADIAMQLAEAAGAQALRDANPPPERAPPRPGPQPAYMLPSTRTAFDRVTASNLFQEFSHCARQAILLEARLDSGAFDQARPIAAHAEHGTAPPPADTGPSCARIGDEIRLHYERLEDDLAGDAHRSPEDILENIRASLDEATQTARADGLPMPLGRDRHTSPCTAPPADTGQAAPKTASHPAPQATQGQPRASPSRLPR